MTDVSKSHVLKVLSSPEEEEEEEEEQEQNEEEEEEEIKTSTRTTRSSLRASVRYARRG